MILCSLKSTKEDDIRYVNSFACFMQFLLKQLGALYKPYSQAHSQLCWNVGMNEGNIMPHMQLAVWLLQGVICNYPFADLVLNSRPWPQPTIESYDASPNRWPLTWEWIRLYEKGSMCTSADPTTRHCPSQSSYGTLELTLWGWAKQSHQTNNKD